MKNDSSWRKCKHCGKYISFNDIEKRNNVEYVFIFDSYYTVEQSHYIHTNCKTLNGYNIVTSVPKGTMGSNPKTHRQT